MGQAEPEDLPIKITSAYGQFAMIPERLIGAGISDAAFRLYAVLALHADRNTNRTFVGHRSIAKLLGKSKRSVIRASSELEDAGIVEVTPRVVGGRQTSNEYRLLIVSSPGAKDVTPGSVTDGMAVTRTKETKETPSSAELIEAERIVKGIYTRDPLINFAAVKRVVERALKLGASPHEVNEAVHGILDAGRAFTAETVRLEIRKAHRPEGSEDPWDVQ